MEHQPPRWAHRFLTWYCNPQLLEDLEGDLNELFYERVQTVGLKKARQLYIWDVCRFVRLHTLSYNVVPQPKPLYLDMFRNYLTIALRIFWRNKLYSLLNVTGLAAGLAVSLLILLFVQHELSYDRFHANAERIFRIKGSINYGEEDMNMEGMSAGVGLTVKEQIPDVLNFVRMNEHYTRALIGRNGNSGKRFYEDKWIFADSSFLSVFSFKLLAGNSRSALREAYTVLITPGMAEKYFGDESPIGQTISFFLDSGSPDDVGSGIREVPFTITGIIEPAPSNSTIDYTFVASFASLAGFEKDQYEYAGPGLGNYFTYFLLASPDVVGKVQQGINTLMPRIVEEGKQHFVLIPLIDMHAGKSSRFYVYIFMGVALLILLLALINYMSLTTARATQRAKEVGIRKVVGARWGQLAGQFFGESLLLTTAAFVLAIGATIGLLPVFHRLVNIQIPYSFLLQPQYLLIGIFVLLGSGVLAGSYPAFLLSGFGPISILTRHLSSRAGGVALRKFFTVFQFSASIALIICSLVMHNQLRYLRTKDIGLTKEHLLVVPVKSVAGKKYQALKAEFAGHSSVLRVAASRNVPFKSEGTLMMFTETPAREQISIHMNHIDNNFIQTLGIDWKLKLESAETFTTGGGKVILNETAVKKLGIRDNPLGELISFDNTNKLEVVGVVKDFHFMSLQQAVASLAFFPIVDTAATAFLRGGYLTIRLSPQVNLKETIQALSQIYEQYESNTPFEYFFLDEAFDQLYKYQDRLANISQVFTGFAILISCLGLFGLATFTAERRTKEIGIRKVLGASAGNIIVLLSKDYLRLVFLSILIAVPIAWYLMHQWLQEFAYRISINWWVFALAGGVALLIALLTVSFRAIKAALANPVHSLRSE